MPWKYIALGLGGIIVWRRLRRPTVSTGGVAAPQGLEVSELGGELYGDRFAVAESDREG